MKTFILGLLTFSVMVFADSSARKVPAQMLVNGNSHLTVPNSGDDYLVARGTTDVLTNKTIDTATNTITGLTDSSIAAGAGIAFNKLANLTSANVLVGSAGNVPTAVALTGDVLISNAGVTSYNGVVPIAKGGTNNGSLAVTAGGMLYTDGSKQVNTGVGTSGQVMMSNAGSPPAFTSVPGNSTILKAPTIQAFTVTGTQTGWLFTISTSSTLAIGDTYTNNAHTYTVQNALTTATGQVLWMSNSQALSGASGTLTKAVSASGPATITYTASVATATYTVPTPTPLYLEIEMVGAGGGGSGGGVSGAAGTDGTTTAFGPNIAYANGGKSASFTNTGGTATVNSPATAMLVLAGATGASGSGQTAATGVIVGGGGAGGSTPFGGAGGGNGGGNGLASANTGSGGSGGGIQTATASASSGYGGGAGAYAKFILSPIASSSYPYVIGAKGTSGTGGTGGFNGGNGADGNLVIKEHYQ